MNKTHLVTNDTWVQCQRSQLFFEKNIVNDDTMNGYDIIVNIDTEERVQIMHIAMDLFTHEERYLIGVNILGGADLIASYAPSKVIKAIEKKGLDKLDEHLNGIVPTNHFDRNFGSFSYLIGGNKNTLSKYDIVHSRSCWTCLIKKALRMKYGKVA